MDPSRCLNKVISSPINQNFRQNGSNQIHDQLCAKRGTVHTGILCCRLCKAVRRCGSRGFRVSVDSSLKVREGHWSRSSGRTVRLLQQMKLRGLIRSSTATACVKDGESLIFTKIKRLSHNTDVNCYDKIRKKTQKTFNPPQNFIATKLRSSSDR